MKTPVIRELIKSGLEQHGEAVWLRQAESIAAQLRAVDLVASDVDECLLPFISQAEAGLYVLRRVMGNVSTTAQARFAASMSLRAGAILSRKLYQKVSGVGRNSQLILDFENFAQGAPLSYFDTSARRLVRKGVPGGADTLRLFSARGVPTGLISLGLDIIVAHYREFLEQSCGVELAFADCTRVVSRDGLFAGFDPEMTLHKPEHKAERLRLRIEQFRAAMPLAMGHDRDDMEMFRVARGHGGLTLGFNPVPDTYPLLDVAVFSPDWHAVTAFLSAALEGGDSRAS